MLSHPVKQIMLAHNIFVIYYGCTVENRRHQDRVVQRHTRLARSRHGLASEGRFPTEAALGNAGTMADAVFQAFGWGNRGDKNRLTQDGTPDVWILFGSKIRRDLGFQ